MMGRAAAFHMATGTVAWLATCAVVVITITIAMVPNGAICATAETNSSAKTAAGRVPEAQPAAPAFSPVLRKALAQSLEMRGPNSEVRTRHLDATGYPLFTNRLLLEKSPYLQQHAHNPVNWYPWGPEAFADARRLNRPVLVSIGYSTCHWCHVMEEESFDSIETAKVLNANFIAIKVDREARPDIDAIYMSAIHAMGERGGWPLNMFVTDDGKPFFGGTYFPPTDRGGRLAFTHVLRLISESYLERREEIGTNADRVAAYLKKSLEGQSPLQSSVLGAPQLQRAMSYYKRVVDREWGGIGQGTKFPSSLPIGLLLREWRRTGDAELLSIVRLTLNRMAAGGIHDHLGGGFHRYSTEPRWLVPHFEKMLYDNALIADAFLDAFHSTHHAEDARVVRDVLDYALREMMDGQGGFYSATDADSQMPNGKSEEGYFFTWTRSEIEAALLPDESRVATAWFGVTDEGSLDGRNVLHTWLDRDVLSSKLGLTRSTFDRLLEVSHGKLELARGLRTAPLRDEKIIVAWNGLMVSALSKAGFVLDEPRYVAAAAKTANTLLQKMWLEGRLFRISLAGEVGGPAFLEDYAFLIRGLIDLFEASAEPQWIEAALALQIVQDEFYLDAVGGGYYRTAKDAEVLLAREKPITDGALPSGNAIAASNLLRLAELTGDDRFREKLALLNSAFATQLAGESVLSAFLLQTVSDQVAGIREIVIVEVGGNSDGEAVDPMLAPLREVFAPNRVLIRTREGKELNALAGILPIVRAKTAIGGKTTAYVCEGRVCQFPTNDPKKFREELALTRARSAQ